MKTGKGPIVLSDEARDRVSGTAPCPLCSDDRRAVARSRHVGSRGGRPADPRGRPADRRFPHGPFVRPRTVRPRRAGRSGGLSRRAVVPPRFHRVRFQSRRLYPARRCGGGRPADRPAGRARRVDDRTQRRLPRGTVSRSARLLRPVAARRIRDAHPFGRSRSTLPAAISIGMLPERPIRTGLESSCRGGTASPLSDTRAALPHPLRGRCRRAIRRRLRNDPSERPLSGRPLRYHSVGAGTQPAACSTAG